MAAKQTLGQFVNEELVRQNTEANDDYTEQEDRLAAALERIGKDQLTELIWTADPETLARRIVTEVTR